MAFLKKKWNFGLHLSFSFEDKPMGTAGGVKEAQGLLGKKDFLALYGDNLCDFDIRKLCAFHRTQKAIATIGVFDSSKTKHTGILAGLVRVGPHGKVEKFIEKRNNQKVENGFVNAGIAVFSPRIFSRIPAGRHYDFGKNVYPGLLRQSRRLVAVEGATYVLASDTAETLKRTRRLAAKVL